MGRMSDERLDQLKSQVSLVDLARSQGHVLKQQGAEYSLSCPFHEDKTPSCFINAEKNVFYCHGCGDKGDVIQWLMKTDGLSFRAACDQLEGSLAPAAPVSKTQSVSLSSVEDAVLINQVLDHYHQCLRSSKEAQAFLKKRGLDDADLINTFKLGYADRSLPQLLPSARSPDGEQVRSQLQGLGLLRESGHELMRGSLVVPILDTQGQLQQLYGRKIRNNLRSGTAYHLYLPQPMQGIWNPECLVHDEVILCEALLDAMSFWVHGFRHVTASYGTNGFTASHLALFKQYNIKKVWVAYDRDAAGDGAALALAKQLEIEKIACYRVQFPKGMDANEYILKMQPAKKALELVLDKAISINHIAAAPQQVLSIPEKAVTLVSDQLPIEEKGDEVRVRFNDRHYRIRGLEQNQNLSHLKINLRVNAGDQLHVDHLDLYQSKLRQHFIQQAAYELDLPAEVIKKDIAKLLMRLESLQEERAQAQLSPQSKQVELSPTEVDEAMGLLKDPNLLPRILQDLDQLGIVGEETNKLVGYLASVSRKLNKPLAIMIQSSSAAGKSSLMDAVLQCVPEEERVHYSAMTGQSLFYMGETNLKHKILAIAEEEGVEQASYALKLLQSEGELTIASTGKDPKTGQLTTQEYRVEGPVMLFMTTTAIDMDPELMNRCLVLTVNENQVQTQAIHDLQRDEEGIGNLFYQGNQADLLVLHRNAQRLLKPVNIVNPYASQLTFMSHQTRTRRDHKKYLSLIRSITLLHQYQRPIKTATRAGESKEYIEVSVEDIRWANQLAHEVLGRTLDELPPQTRKLLNEIYGWVCEQVTILGMEQCDFRFTRKQIRESLEWGNTQLKMHLSRLEEMEYLIVHGGGRGRSLHYELLYKGEGQNRDVFMMGLVDVETLVDPQDAKKSGLLRKQSGSSRGQVGIKSAGGHAAQNQEYTAISGLNAQLEETAAKSANQVKTVLGPTYINGHGLAHGG